MIPGSSTPEGTFRYAARFPGARENQFFRTAQGRAVSSLGLGSYLGEMDDATDEGYRNACTAALRGGINVIDTAINYRQQRSERALGQALAQFARDEYLICTKAGFLTPGAVPENPQEVVANMHSMHPDYLAHQIERSCENLGLETLDVFYLHNPETQLRFVPAEQFDDRLRRAFLRLEELARAGRILFYGAATWTGFRQKPGAAEALSLKRMLKIAHEAGGEEHRFRFVQLPLNLGMPEAFTYPHDTDGGEAQNLVEVAVRGGVTAVASASILQARLASDLPEELAAKLPGPITDAQRAIQFTRSTPGLTTALVGMSREEHVRENLGVATFPPATVDQYLNLFQRSAG